MVTGWARLGIVLSLAVLTTGQVAHWTDDRALWGHALRVTPHNPRALINYGNVLTGDGDERGAMFCYRQALQAVTDPRRSPARSRRQSRAAQMNLDRAQLLDSLREGTF